MAECREILGWCAQTLQTDVFRDYAPNGLQVEGKTEIGRIVTSVTASKAAVDFAVAQQADILLVHHGMFWRSEPVTVTGWKKVRIETLLRHQINLAGYHLPLDAYPELGNSAQPARLLDWELEKQFGEQNLLNADRLKKMQSLAQLTQSIELKLGRKPIVIGDAGREVRRITWCTGGAQGFSQTVIDEDVNTYVTGEISKAQYYSANETGAASISAGRHATERYGVRALGEALAQRSDVVWCCFDEPNPT